MSAMAFLVVGPQVNIPASLSSLSKNAAQGTRELARKQTDISACKSIECVGTKVVISAGIQTVGNIAAREKRADSAQILSLNQAITANFPQPRPRILRPG